MFSKKLRKSIFISFVIIALILFGPFIFMRSSILLEDLKQAWFSGKDSALISHFQTVGNGATNLDQVSEAISYMLMVSDNSSNEKIRNNFKGMVKNSIQRGYSIFLNMKPIDRANSEQVMRFALNMSGVLKKIGKDTEALGWERLARLIKWRLEHINRRLADWKDVYLQAKDDTSIADLTGIIDKDFCSPEDPSKYFNER